MQLRVKIGDSEFECKGSEQASTEEIRAVADQLEQFYKTAEKACEQKGQQGGQPKGGQPGGQQGGGQQSGGQPPQQQQPGQSGQQYGG